VGSLEHYEAESQRVVHFAANLELGCANIGNNDSSEASTVGNAVDSAYFVWRLDDFAAFTPDYKPDLSTDKSRTTCIGGGAATTCEVTSEEAASWKVNMSSSCQKAAC